VNSNQAIRKSRELLKASGATVVRQAGGHEIHRFPSGRIYPLQVHVGAWRARTFKKTLAAIRRAARSESPRP
jgi:hypothetical protein